MASQGWLVGARRLQAAGVLLRTNNITPAKAIIWKRATLKGCKRHLITSFVYRAVPSTQILMPALSPTMEEGTIIKWLKKEGDTVSAGDVLCEIETDKATISMDSDEEGILAKIIVAEGTRNVKINQLIALMVDEGVDYTQVEVPVDTEMKPTGSLDPPEKSGRAHSDADFSELMSPAVRVLLETYHLDPRLIPATGPKGRLLKGDVLRFVAQGGKPFTTPEEDGSVEVKQPARTEAPVPIIQAPATQAVIPPPPLPSPAPSSRGVEPIGADYTDVPHTSIRRTIAKRLAESKASIPHAYASTNCVMDNLLRLRRGLDVKVSVNDFIVKAAALSLRKVPEMNATWSGGLEEARLLPEVDVSVAVATEAGLITPIVKNADKLTVGEISLILKDLASRAREGKLQLHEFQGGSFTISNLGMYGITEFSAVINPPQACIMAVASTRPVLTTEDTIQQLMTVTLSCDGRVVDDALASRWLEVFQANMENPEMLLL